MKNVSPEYFADYIKLPRAKMPTRPAEERKHDFQEINLAFPRPSPGRGGPLPGLCCHDFAECKLIRCANLYELQPERIQRLKGDGEGKVHPSYKEKRLVAIERDQASASSAASASASATRWWARACWAWWAVDSTR